jgi:phage repressor protein C with HTH and peptisase S24 domain
MEPLIAEGGIVVADLSDDVPARIREGKIYELCYDLDFGECAVKFLSWAAKDRLLAIGSQNAALYPAVYRKPSEVRIVGRVIWASREIR